MSHMTPLLQLRSDAKSLTKRMARLGLTSSHLEVEVAAICHQLKLEAWPLRLVHGHSSIVPCLKEGNKNMGSSCLAASSSSLGTRLRMPM